MAVRFIIGRAGTGKTHHCLEAVRKNLRVDPIDGPRLVLLVPEQAGLQMEQAVIGPSDIGGAHRAEVLSFERLAHRVLEEAGDSQRLALSDAARAMVLRHIVRSLSRELRYYRRIDRLGGYVERLAATITELIQEAVKPEELSAAAENAGGDDPTQPMKLHDLRLIYQAYLDYLGDERLDPSQRLAAARERLHYCTWLNGAELWVDGFASFSGQEMMTLVALAGQCQHVDITMFLDPSLCTVGKTHKGLEGLARLFKKTLGTYGNLLQALADAGVAIEEPLLLRPDCPPRFANRHHLAMVESNLFADARGRTSSGVNTSGGAPVDVELVELPSRRVEVDYAVSRICGWVRDGDSPMLFSDIAIIARDLELYHDLIVAALTAKGIPFFIDRRRRTSHHPLVELIRAALAIALERMSLQSVRLLLKTDLLGIGIDAADELENYLIAFGLSGLDVWHGAEWTYSRRASLVADDRELGPAEAERIKRVNETRRLLLDLVDPWVTSATKGGRRDGPAWVEAITNWFGRLGVAERIEGIAREAEDDGDPDLAAEHRQVWRDTMSFLDDLAFAFSDKTLSIEELNEIIEQGLSGLTLGLAPPMIDQVLVGSIERSRHPDIKAALIIGCNDGVFPRLPEEDVFLNDEDRTLLRSCGLRVEPSRRDRVLDESMLFYVAMTRASESLVVTYANSDNDGKALRPSPYLAALCTACAGLTITAIGDPVHSRSSWDILSWRDLAARVIMEFRTRPALTADDATVRARWNELYEVARGRIAEDAGLRRTLDAMAEPQVARLAPDRVGQVFGEGLRASVSQLETYAACPFQYFGRYVLRLREREEASLAPVDVGQVHHAILEDFVRDLSARREGFAQLGDDELLGKLGESCGRIAARLPDGGVVSDARNAYMLRRSASFLARVIRSQREVSKCGTARPRAAELPFGIGEGLPAVRITTPKGRRVELRGFIDRVDIAELGDEMLGVVIDYKQTPDKRFDLTRVYHGLSLQLVGYLLALAEHGASLAGRRVRPVGALYVSLAPKYQRVDHPDLASAGEAESGGCYKPRGLLLADTLDALDNTGSTGTTGWSGAYQIYRKKDGSLGNVDRSDVAQRDAFDAILDHTKRKLGSLADGILDGRIAVNPYRLRGFSPCSWCAMSSVCGFEMGVCDVRFLESLKRPEAIERLIALTHDETSSVDVPPAPP